MKTINCLALVLLLAQCLLAQRPTELNVTTFTNFNYPDVEPVYNYDFVAPVKADILDIDSASYTPDQDYRYFMSIYGPRHKQVDSSNIGFFDFHKGSDMTAEVTNEDGVFDEQSPPDIQCMCDGIVYETYDDENLEEDEDIEDTGTGRFVIIKCDSTFKANPAWGNIYMAYRHLDSINANLKEYVNGTVNVSKGDFIGSMGASGHTSTVHLHYSLIRRNTGSQVNVHPMRVFNPAAYPHLLHHLDEAEIYQLDYTDSSAFFRIVVPYNRANIRALEVNLVGGNDTRVYDFEEISLLPEATRDDNDVVDGLELFAYPFNRGTDAYTRLWRRFDDNQITTVYPANPDHDHFAPFLSEGLLATPAYAMDIKVSDLPQGFNINNLEIKVIDIFGYGVSAYGTTSTQHFSWSIINQDSDDAEEFASDANENPDSVQLTDIDLELVRDYNKHGNQTVGLRFSDLGVPPGAVVTKAWIQFRADYGADPENVQETNLIIKAENTANAQTFQSLHNNLTNRDTTEMAINWQILDAWTPSMMGPDQKVEVTELVQEVMSRQHDNWTTASPLSFLIQGTGKRKAESYDPNATEKSPYLYIEYTLNSLTSLGYAPEVFFKNPANGAEFFNLAAINLEAIAFDPDYGLAKVEFWVNGNKVGEDQTIPYSLDWNPPAYGNYQITAVAIDSEDNSSDSAIHSITITNPNENFSFWKRIDEGDFDVEEHQDGTIWKNNSDLEMCWDTYVPTGASLPIRQQHVGLQFAGIDIPKNASITNAYVQFTADESHSNNTTISIWGEKNGNPESFSYDDFDVSSRIQTDTSVSWIPPSWSTGDSTVAQRTPDISSIIQEIIGLPDWYQGDSLVLIFHSNDTGRRTAVSYNQEPTEAPILYIDYTLDGNALSAPVSPNIPMAYDKPHQIDMDLKVSPNPVKGGMARVEIFTPIQEDVAKISIINNNGQRVKFRQIVLMDTKSTTFDLSKCPPGSYFAVVELRDDVISEKFILLKD